MFSAKVHPFTIASAGFESATFWIQVTYARHSAKLSNVPLSINDFILHYVDNFVTKRTLPQRIEFDWIDHQFTYTVHCMKSRAQLSWNSTFRWAPKSRTGGVLLRAKIIFWNETSFQKWFLLTDLFYFYMYLLFFLLCLFLLFRYLFLSLFFFLFSYLIYFYKFLFSTYLFFLSHLEHRLHQQTPWMISSTNNNKPRAVNGLLVWNWSNTKPIR